MAGAPILGLPVSDLMSIGNVNISTIALVGLLESSIWSAKVNKNILF